VLVLHTDSDRILAVVLGELHREVFHRGRVAADTVRTAEEDRKARSIVAAERIVNTDVAHTHRIGRIVAARSTAVDEEMEQRREEYGLAAASSLQHSTFDPRRFVDLRELA
jgi:hypothetical protein